MKGKLAIITHDIGAPSETFIRRHIESLLPGKTVVLTHNIVPAFEATWEVSCPVYLINRPTNPISKGMREVLRKIGVDAAEYIDIEGIKKFLVEQEVRVLLGNYINVSWPFIRIANELGIHFYVHAHGYDLSILFRKPVWRRRYADYKYASGVIVLNKIMRKRLLSVGVPEEMIHIIPCGVDVPEKPIARNASDTVCCLAVGRMIGKKAPAKLLESFRLALQRNSNLYLDYVGTGPLFKKVQEYVIEYCLQNHVTLHGGQPHQKIIDLLQRADLFLQHSIIDPETGDEEGMPVVILEAMGYGLPVVTTRHAGIPEAVRDGITGYIVEEGDVDTMAQHILELAGNTRKRAMMGQAGWKIARDNFTWQTERAKLLDVMGIDE